ncbi:protein tyrosine phosphatase family protein [Pseudohongiella sp. SYSU M77423]|uniref:protein tyrosine phosphatase family protein n=1 Tax=Pseudohongiella sp. SYSU M77423 TaxID=3042312 RepID=UPI000C4135E6|nr:protein tyrosine phosphatase family protein [Pseudohongiella sp. SYSU M77423]MAY56456.1 phosphatase [Gammaproteobacteria bacterium]MBJ54635.1 phosphatase [Gammaproteobacteria bacterium]MDH7943126.1 protein tyrosine phosphatase family protein [Pseudohongiella sp. SYSU M77423]MEC8860261.1 protein tyrosine phosphatase family protein [Pseudomonadota bacterium]|tara:strand:- start:26 stop:601 length:576 start_codon:yes stop_codon:yes gene_type:complete
MKRKLILKVAGALLGVLIAASVNAQSTLSDVLNLREYSDTFASAGQPTAEQFEAIRDAGYERVIYIAFTTNDNALANADQVVKGLGMDYLHIPVDWNNPTKRDFYAFADAMQRNPEQKTLLHCQVNARATAFSFMYRVVYEDVPVAEAKADMNTVWQPNETWRDLIFEVLADHGISPDCEGCDWTPSQVGG